MSKAKYFNFSYSRHWHLLLVCLVVACVCTHHPVAATQLGFKRTESDQSIQFDYRWIDADEKTHRVKLDFNKSELAERQRTLINYRPDIAQRHIYIEVMKAIQNVDPREARFDVQQMPSELVIAVRASSQEKEQKWLQTMHNKQAQAYSNYLQDNHYNIFTTPTGVQSIKPDHRRFITDNVRIMLPIAKSLYNVLGDDISNRAFANLLLSWLQSIPYNALDDRRTSNGSGYLPPTEVINNNVGDCDSKTVLAASILRAIYPRLSMVIIYLPDHALLGATLPHLEEESRVEINGLDYLLLEPTGPALFKVGEVAESTQFHIESGMYTHEKVP